MPGHPASAAAARLISALETALLPDNAIAHSRMVRSSALAAIPSRTARAVGISPRETASSPSRSTEMSPDDGGPMRTALASCTGTEPVIMPSNGLSVSTSGRKNGNGTPFSGSTTSAFAAAGARSAHSISTLARERSLPLIASRWSPVCEQRWCRRLQILAVCREAPVNGLVGAFAARLRQLLPRLGVKTMVPDRAFG